MELVLPSQKYEVSFIQAVKEYQAVDSNGVKGICQLNVEDLKTNFPTYIFKILSQTEGNNLPDGHVPQTVYWLIDNGEFIGRVTLRHSLTQRLHNEGGHIGYDIRPSKRKMGYGKKILELALPKAKGLGLTKVLVTCDETNLASKKIIETHGGVFENSLKLHEDKPAKLRYWITI